MNILFVSECGDSVFLAKKVEEEGHNSFLYTEEKCASHVGEGLVQRTKCHLPLITETHKCIRGNVGVLIRETQPDLCVFDMVGMGEVADYLSKNLHIPTMGGCKWADFAELEREYGYKLMKSAGISTPTTDVFTSGEREKAISFVQSHKQIRYVYKPNGNISTSHTYVSKGWEDMCAMLKVWEGDECDFELQEFVEGVEVSCEMWWNGTSSFLHNWTMEEKKMMDGNVGATVGCAGNLVHPILSTCKLISEGVGKMERLLKKTNYRGPIDLNSIVTKEGMVGLEWTVRFGYDAMQAMLEIYRGSITQLLHCMASGSTPERKLEYKYAAGVRISIPPYPHTQKDTQMGIPLLGINSSNAKHIQLADVKQGKGWLESAGCDGNLACVTARGDSVNESTERCYRTIHNLVIPQLQYRGDIGLRVSGDVGRLRGWGYL